MGGGFGFGEGTSLTIRNRRTPRPLVVTVVLAVAACGSSEPQLVDPGALERSIPQALLPTAPELVEQVSCPPMDAERLSTVSCTVTIVGHPISVTVTGPDLFKGVRVSAADSLVWASDLADRAGERLDTDLGAGNSVVCEPVVRVAKAGQIFDCAVAGSDGQSRLFVATLLDATGSFRFDVQDG